MIEVNNIVKKFGDQTVLKGVSTRFEAGMTNLIIDQSGSGKTVFLKSLLGIHTPDSGTISFDGRMYSELSNDEKRALRTEIGMVFQGSALFDSMTVEENIGFPLKMFTNKTPAEIKERVDFVVDRVHLVNANYERPSELLNQTLSSARTGGPEDYSFRLTNLDTEDENQIEANIKQIENSSSPENMPTMWAKTGKINNEFSFRRNPFGGRSYEFHPGLDIDGEKLQRFEQSTHQQEYGA